MADLTFLAVVGSAGTATPVILAAAGAASGLTSNVADQLLNTGEVDSGEALVATVGGGVGGFVLGKVLGPASSQLIKYFGKTGHPKGKTWIGPLKYSKPYSISEKIVKNNMDEAVDVLDETAQKLKDQAVRKGNEEIESEIVQAMSRVNRVKTQNKEGISSTEDMTVELNQIRLALKEYGDILGSIKN